MQIEGKKVLVMGLGILGGGVATSRKLFELGAELTITDMKDSEYLKSSIEKLKDLDGIKFVLGEHREKDFLNNDIIVVNPDVPIDNKFIKLAKENGKQIENELSLFFKLAETKNLVGITGTRGKTTTTNWTAHILNSKIVGNSPDNPFLGEWIENKERSLVLEVPSFQLELLGELVESQGYKLSPHIAVITNLYRDHINRHKSMEGYALAKANIFRYQDENDFLILNKDNEWTDFFLKQNPKAKVVFVSKEDTYDFLEKQDFIDKWGEHNFLNLSISISIAKILGINNDEIKQRIETLPQIKFRQEKVFDNGELQVYNDTSATSPEASIAAINRYNKKDTNFILIAGGTDKELDFEEWGSFVSKNLQPENLVILSGSATEKMKKCLSFLPKEFDSLEECIKEALIRAKGKSVIVFSPGAKSFEKFKNEFDRGEKFNQLLKDNI